MKKSDLHLQFLSTRAMQEPAATPAMMQVKSIANAALDLMCPFSCAYSREFGCLSV
jgi:hypothetical protein